MVQLSKLRFGGRRKQVRRSVLTMIFLLAVLFCGLASAQEQLQPSIASSTSTSLPPQIPATSVQDVADCQAAIRDAFRNPDQVGLVEAAIPKADHLAQIRTQYQGSGWWQTVDARQDLADLNRIADLNASQRGRLATAERTVESVAIKSDRSDEQNAEVLRKLASAEQTESQIFGAESRWRARTLVMMGRVALAERRTAEAEADFSLALDDPS